MAPGPRVTMHTPGRPGLGHECGTALLPVNHKLDLGLVAVKAVEYGQKTLARHTKGVGYTLFDETLHQQVAGDLRGW